MFDAAFSEKLHLSSFPRRGTALTERLRQWPAILLCHLLLGILALMGYRFVIARKAAERRQVFRMRWQVYCQAG
ncbi:MAG: hypothetical protein D6758_09825 [Gammaproteobacteria bacterium]|nr:MAG: hypothetical protein D6758_09825 [Gammaproteobacteria bacterium]